MYSLLFLGLVSCIVALVLTPLVRNLAWHYGVVDHPDQQRKLHGAPIPRIGGVAIVASVIIAYALLLGARLSAGLIVWEGLPLTLRILPALTLVFGIGLTDDIVSLRPWQKLIAEVGAAMLAWVGGIHVNALAGHSLSSISVSIVVTILWIVTCTNAINLIDGVDGLAAGVSLFAAITMLIAAILDHNIPMALAIAPLTGALLGFLRYNFNPASVFLGDCGSLTLGFLLACYGAVWSDKSTTLLGMTAPLLVLAVPLLDVGLAIIRRFLRGQRIFSADYAHIHHKLLSKGLTPTRCVLVIYGICAIGAAASLLLTISENQNRGFVIVLVCLATWLGLQQLGYSEFAVAGRVFRVDMFQSSLSAQFALEAFEKEVRAEISIQQCWDLVSRSCPQFGFSGVIFHLDDVHHRWGVDSGWQARIDFPGHGYITLWRESGATSRGTAAGLFMDCLLRSFSQKLSHEEANSMSEV